MAEVEWFLDSVSWCWLVYFCGDSECYLSKILDGSLWFVFFFFNFFFWGEGGGKGGGSIFTDEYKSNVYVFEKNILSDFRKFLVVDDIYL